MSIPYIVLEKHNPQNGADPKRYYAQAKSIGKLDLREVAGILSQRSTVSTADVVAVLEGLIELVPEKLLEGYLVKLGDFGTFRAGFSSKGEVAASQVTKASISKPRINFLPGKVLKNELKKASFSKWKQV